MSEMHFHSEGWLIQSNLPYVEHFPLLSLRIALWCSAILRINNIFHGNHIFNNPPCAILINQNSLSSHPSAIKRDLQSVFHKDNIKPWIINVHICPSLNFKKGNFLLFLELAFICDVKVNQIWFILRWFAHQTIVPSALVP